MPSHFENIAREIEKRPDIIPAGAEPMTPSAWEHQLEDALDPLRAWFHENYGAIEETFWATRQQK